MNSTIRRYINLNLIGAGLALGLGVTYKSWVMRIIVFILALVLIVYTNKKLLKGEEE